MPTQLLSIGFTGVITQNVVYALPAQPSVVTTTLACETALISTGPWTAFTSGGTTTAKFIRCTTGAPTVSVGKAVAGAGGGSVSGDIAVTSVAIGASPSLTGALRLSDGGQIKSRTSGGTDRQMMRWSGSGTLEIGDDAGGDLVIKGGNTYIQGGGQLALDPTASANGGSLRMRARTNANPIVSSNYATLWIKDVAGKMALMITYPGGTSKQIDLEP